MHSTKGRIYNEYTYGIQATVQYLTSVIIIFCVPRLYQPPLDMQLIIIFNSVNRKEKGLGQQNEIYERGSTGKSSRARFPFEI